MESASLPFRIFTRPAWGSRRAGHRGRLRRFIHAKIEPDPAVLDLERRPGEWISISHHREAGGFALCRRGLRVGFDMELNHRARPELVSRVRFSDAEWREAPTPAALWTAKEAAFKALADPDQPRELSQIEIGEWQATDLGIYRCRVTALRSGRAAPERGDARGWVWCEGEETFAVFLSVLLPEARCAG